MGMEFANLSRLKLRKIQGGALLWSSSDTLEVVTVKKAGLMKWLIIVTLGST